MKAVLAASLAILPSLFGLSARAEQIASDQDRHFVAQAIASGQEEVEAGRLAQSQAGMPAVRVFGRWMAADHTLVGQLVQMRAKEAGISVPAAPAQKSAMDKLKAAHDRQFDAAYLSVQVQDHEKAVALFQQEAQSGVNPGLKSLAQLVLPALQEHLAQAKELSTLAYATTTRAPEQPSTSSAAPPATAKQTTTSSSQGPAVQQMNKEAKDRIEKEGK
jgi:putative membrane protein